MISFSATGSPTAPTTDVLYINAMASENGGQMEPKNSSAVTISPGYCIGVVTIVRT